MTAPVQTMSSCRASLDDQQLQLDSARFELSFGYNGAQHSLCQPKEGQASESSGKESTAGEGAWQEREHGRWSASTVSGSLGGAAKSRCAGDRNKGGRAVRRLAQGPLEICVSGQPGARPARQGVNVNKKAQRGAAQESAAGRVRLGHAPVHKIAYSVLTAWPGKTQDAREPVEQAVGTHMPAGGAKPAGAQAAASCWAGETRLG